jgi:murein hydrolase activator
VIRAAVLALLLAGPVSAQDPVEAADNLRAAIAALDDAQGARDRVAALTTTIRAYEQGLSTLRDALRQVTIRESALTMRLTASQDDIARLLGVLSQIDPNPGPTLLFDPGGPLSSVRSGMIIADITPALQARVEGLRSDLAELQSLRRVQTDAQALLEQGLISAQGARTELSQAISDRTDLPRRYTEDAAALQALVRSADTLQALAQGLTMLDPDRGRFAERKGTLPLPVLGRMIRAAGEPDPAGVSRPGVTLATRPGALVTAPHAVTIRYLGPLLDYGNVMMVEPGDGYLIVLAGLGSVYGQVGEVVPAGGALGLMGGQADADLADAGDTETLYVEVRRGTEPEDPQTWFTGLAPAE